MESKCLTNHNNEPTDLVFIYIYFLHIFVLL